MKYARRKFKRRTFRRRKFRRPTRLRYAKGSVHGSSSLRRFARNLGKLAERKIHSVDGTVITDVNGDILTFPVIAQGNTGSTRVGNKIFVRYWTVKMLIYFQAGIVWNGSVRISVVVPKASTYAAIGDMPTTSITQAWDTEKYTVIKDTQVIFQTTEPSKMHYIKIPWFKSIEYVGGVLVGNVPILFVWSNVAFGAAAKCSFDYHSRLTFTDV